MPCLVKLVIAYSWYRLPETFNLHSGRSTHLLLHVLKTDVEFVYLSKATSKIIYVLVKPEGEEE